jgi:hypothetical protein
LKKGTKQHPDDWDASRKDWTHMVLHFLPWKGERSSLLLLRDTILGVKRHTKTPLSKRRDEGW